MKDTDKIGEIFMRTVEEIKKEYEATKVYDEFVEVSMDNFRYKNEDKREALREEYISILPKNQQLAIWLHSEMCIQSHSCDCSFLYEINGLEDDWSGTIHKRYLRKADRALKVTDGNVTLVKDIISAVVEPSD